MTTYNYNEIIEAVILLDDIQTLKRLRNAVLERMETLSKKATRAMRSGDRVRWTGRSGQTVFGTVIKPNRKTVSIRADDGTQWRVSTTLLEVVQ